MQSLPYMRRTVCSGERCRLPCDLIQLRCERILSRLSPLCPQLKVTFGDQLIRVYDNTAINTGYYTFSYVKDGEAKTLPARYSLTYVKDGNSWLIADHHSSAMPAAPPR